MSKALGREQITFFDVFDSYLKHQAVCMKTSLFQRFGLYDETLRIVADYDFFLKSLGLGDASYRFINTDLSCFNKEGMSSTNRARVESEARLVRERHLSRMMLPDYELLARHRNLRHIEKTSALGWLHKQLGKLARHWSGE